MHGAARPHPLPLVIALLAAGPLWAEPPRPPVLVVAAAASLTEALPRAAASFSAPTPAFRFDASSRLARQIEQGMEADLFVSADVAWMDELSAKGRIVPGSRRTLAGNRLVVVVPSTAAEPPRDLEALAARADGKGLRLALAAESVPAGRYARAALSSTGKWAVLGPRVVSGESVRGALAWVARGEADAGIVYATDALVEAQVKVAFTLPEGSYPPIVYPAAVVAGSRHPVEARALLEALAGPKGRAAFVEAGFTAPPASPAR